MNSLDEAQAMLLSEGYVVFKPAPTSARLRQKQLYACDPVHSPTLVDHYRSSVIQQTAMSIIEKGIRPLNSKFNWRILEQAFRSTRRWEGEIWELGVYQGVTATLLANCLRADGDPKTHLRLFDTFKGMPDTDPDRDIHVKGNFSDTSLEEVSELVGTGINVTYHPGFIPTTFEGLTDVKLKLVHIDLDLYQPILDTLRFCYSRMVQGIIVFDDYGTPSCPGALDAVDEFFQDKPEAIFCFHTGQAMIFKHGV